MNISKRTRTLTIAGILTAITFLLGLTPVGYIPLPTMKITILCIPVLVGVLLEGLTVGIWLGFIFGLTSLIQIFMGDVFGVYIMNISVFKTLLVVFVPRLLVPVAAYGVFQAMKRIGKSITTKMGYGVAALVGSLTNTVLFLGMFYLLFIPELDQIAAFLGTSTEGVLAVIGGIITTNGIPEAIAAVIIVTAICLAVKPLYNKKETLAK